MLVLNHMNLALSLFSFQSLAFACSARLCLPSIVSGCFVGNKYYRPYSEPSVSCKSFLFRYCRPESGWNCVLGTGGRKPSSVPNLVSIPHLSSMFSFSCPVSICVVGIQYFEPCSVAFVIRVSRTVIILSLFSTNHNVWTFSSRGMLADPLQHEPHARTARSHKTHTSNSMELPGKL